MPEGSLSNTCCLHGPCHSPLALRNSRWHLRSARVHDNCVDRLHLGVTSKFQQVGELQIQNLWLHSIPLYCFSLPVWMIKCLCSLLFSLQPSRFRSSLQVNRGRSVGNRAMETRLNHGAGPGFVWWALKTDLPLTHSGSFSGGPTLGGHICSKENNDQKNLSLTIKYHEGENMAETQNNFLLHTVFKETLKKEN